jgi:hypothetical protein
MEVKKKHLTPFLFFFFGGTQDLMLANHSASPFLVFDIGSYYVTQARLELAILLPHPPEN